MRALIARYAADDRMLVRSRDFLLEHLRDFVVAQDATGFLGCCALAVLTPDLAEVRSLAVTPEASGQGIGKALVLACVAEARRLGLRRIFALTLVPEFFERCGFVLTSLGRLPENSAAECPVCPKRFACDEHAMLLHLDGTTPLSLAPGEPVGYTRLFLHTEPQLAPTCAPGSPRSTRSRCPSTHTFRPVASGTRASTSCSGDRPRPRPSRRSSSRPTAPPSSGGSRSVTSCSRRCCSRPRHRSCCSRWRSRSCPWCSDREARSPSASWSRRSRRSPGASS